jgi:hypothetical protein
MADVDAETIERVVRWCADAGRQAVAGDIRRALSPLTWNELLSVKALLADPPPARPLGPQALADIARGAPPDLAAEREREGRYAALSDEPDRPSIGAPRAPGALGRGRPSRRKGAHVVIRRARDRVPNPPPTSPPLPDLEKLREPEGRAVLERLVRRRGGRRAALVADLGAGWRRADGAPPADADLDALLDHHGLARGFERRERDEILHALRAAGGVRALAAVRVGLDADRLDAAIARLGARGAADAIREERRAELRAQATLAERVRLVVTSGERLRDLEVLAEFEADLRARLPEHVRALRAGRAPLAPALARSLSLTVAEATALAVRFGLELGGERTPRPRGPPATRPRRPSPSSAARPQGPASPASRNSAPRGSVPRGSVPRGSVPRGSVPRGSAPRGSVPRGSAPRGSAPRSSGPRSRRRGRS